MYTEILTSSVQIRCLVEKWVAGEIAARVFTDQWPDCTCVVVLYQEWLPQHGEATNSKLIPRHYDTRFAAILDVQSDHR